MKGISIVVCCYNSAVRLPATIKHLSAQLVPSEIPWEVIVVDNASTDNTKDVAVMEWAKYTLPSVGFNIVDESKQGLNNAREKGLNESRYEYLLFCDDDNWLDSDYVRIAFELMEKNRNIGVLCGSSKPANQQLPIWFTSFQLDYAVGVQSLYSGDISIRGFCWGAGMVLRKSVLLDLKKSGFTPLLTDRKGDALTSGGDAEICKWFLIAGYRLWYEESLTFYHYIPESRLNKEYLTKLRQSFDIAYKYIDYYDYYIYFTSRKESLVFKIAKIPYHLSKWVFIGNVHSKLYLFSMFPLVAKKYDVNYFAIRSAASSYHKNRQKL